MSSTSGFRAGSDRSEPTATEETLILTEVPTLELFLIEVK